MNHRKFYFIFSSVILIFLFASGLLILNYMNTAVSGNNHDSGENRSSFWDNIIPKKDPINVLILGGDKVSGNTDTIMLANFNPETTKVNIISIPRDTKVRIDGSNQKINFAFPHGGPELAVKTVGNLLSVNINYYVYVDTKVFRNIIDILGGVKDFYVPVDMDYDDPAQNLHIHLKKGVQDMDGKKAEQFMRFRHPNGRYSKELREYYDGSDLKRIEAQQRFLKELVRQKANILYLPKFKDVIEEIFDNVETNMAMSDALKMAQNIVKFSIDNVDFLGMIPGTTSDSSPWYYLCDVEKTAEIVQQYFYAEGSFVYNGNIIDTKSNINNKSDDDDDDNENKPAAKKTNKNNKNNKNAINTKDVTKNNPSNTETSVKETTQPQP